jgi:hypothetical protein
MLFAAVEKAISGGRGPPPEVPIQISIDADVNVAVSAASSRDTETSSAVGSAFQAMSSKLSLASNNTRPSLIVAAFTCTHDADEVINALHHLCPDVPVAGMTTCRGVVMNGTWSTHRKEYALGLWAISDEAGDYAVGQVCNRETDFPSAMATELVSLLATRSCIPSFVLLLGSPGGEEETLVAMRNVLDPAVPILGGSSADNKVQGEWRQVAKTGSSAFGAKAPGAASTDGGKIYITHTRVSHDDTPTPCVVSRMETFFSKVLITCFLTKCTDYALAPCSSRNCRGMVELRNRNYYDEWILWNRQGRDGHQGGRGEPAHDPSD